VRREPRPRAPASLPHPARAASCPCVHLIRIRCVPLHLRPHTRRARPVAISKERDWQCVAPSKQESMKVKPNAMSIKWWLICRVPRRQNPAAPTDKTGAAHMGGPGRHRRSALALLPGLPEYAVMPWQLRHGNCPSPPAPAKQVRTMRAVDLLGPDARGSRTHPSQVQRRESPLPFSANSESRLTTRTTQPR
jgi:hypothetical protein